MSKKTLFMVIVFAITVSFGTAFAGPNMNPGKWEITTQTEMIGVAMAVPPVTHIQCLKAENLVPQSEEAGKECQITDIKTSGDTVSWTIVCSGKNGRMEGTGKVTYSGDRMQGTMDMVIKGAGMKVKNRISGKRIGSCD